MKKCGYFLCYNRNLVQLFKKKNWKLLNKLLFIKTEFLSKIENREVKSVYRE